MEITYEQAVKHSAGTAIYNNTKTGRKYDQSHPYNIANFNFIFAFFPEVDAGKVIRDIKREFNKQKK